MGKLVGIYAIISPSGKAYIGSSCDINSRKRNHFYQLKKGIHHCDGLQNAWFKYKRDLKHVVLEICEIDMLIEKEQWWIDNGGYKFGRLYNSSKVAGRIEMNTAAIAKMSAAKKGKTYSEEYKKNMSIICTGRTHTNETKDKMRQSWTPERRKAHGEKFKIRMALKREKNALSKPPKIEKVFVEKKPFKHSEETKAKMRKPKTAEHAAAISRAKKGVRGKPHSDEAKRMRSELLKRQYENGERNSDAAAKSLRIKWADPDQRNLLIAKQRATWTDEKRAKQANRMREYHDIESRARRQFDSLNWIVGSHPLGEHTN